MSNDENKFQPIFQILHSKSAWFLLELAMALVTTIGMRFLQVCKQTKKLFYIIKKGFLAKKKWSKKKEKKCFSTHRFSIKQSFEFRILFDFKGQTDFAMSVIEKQDKAEIKIIRCLANKYIAGLVGYRVQRWNN